MLLGFVFPAVMVVRETMHHWGKVHTTFFPKVRVP